MRLLEAIPFCKKAKDGYYKNDNVVIYVILIKITQMIMVMVPYKEKDTNAVSLWKDPGIFSKQGICDI